ncbi:hypothetical protein MMC25_003245 [Agyrium rufum]|nr:hypothetical protein [Agyrium rufum]
MAPTILPTYLVLLVLVLLAYYGTWHLLNTNGTAAMMIHIRDHGPHVLPGTSAPLRRTYTGIEAIDYQLTVLALFFWEILDGSRPDAVLQGFHFTGQFGAAYGLLMIESLRGGNKWRIVSLAVIWGLLIQNLSYALCAPVYSIIHLASSPTARKATTQNIQGEGRLVLAIIPGLIFGYILPAKAMALPAPVDISFDHKQLWMSAWQVFPIFVATVQYPISVLVPREAVPWRSACRLTYGFLLILATCTHLMAFTTTMLDNELSLAQVFLPKAFTNEYHVSSIGEGAHLLLQYDQIVGSMAMLLWSYQLYQETTTSQDTTIFLPNPAISIIAFILITGPIGCATALIWYRDEMVLRSKERSARKQI